MKKSNLTSKKLEFSNKIKDLIKYYDLGYILNNIESIIFLPIPYKNPNMTTEEYNKNREIAMDIMSSSSIKYHYFFKEWDIRKTTFDYIKKTHPNFCESMKSKIPAEDYEEYLYLLKKCSKDISKLINSFVDRDNDYQDLLMRKKDAISTIIDSESNSRLTFFQDSFVLDELSSVDYSDMDPAIQKNIEIIKSDLNQRIDKYHTFQKLYSSKNIVRIKRAIEDKKEIREI